MPLFLRFFHSVRPAMMPDRIVCNSPNRRWAFEGGANGEGLNNSQYSRMCDASTPSVLLRLYSCQRRYPIFRRSQSYPSTSSLQHELRFEQPCTQDLRSCASQDTVQSEQRSLEKRGLIYRTGSFAKGTQEAHRSPRCSANLSICGPVHFRRWSDAGYPRFRRDPCARDVAFDPGGTTTPRIMALHMLRSAVHTVSAPAISS